VADACMDTAVSVELFVEILNRYVYYFDQQNEAVSHSGDRQVCSI
jgi:vacuolar protein sorting-associated protein 35